MSKIDRDIRWKLLGIKMAETSLCTKLENGRLEVKNLYQYGAKCKHSVNEVSINRTK
jgi:hypothetical protein